MKGFLITFEGIDFCGKSVQIEQLVNKLQAKQVKFSLLREPGGTIISEKIREALLTKEKEDMNPVTEYLLFSAARAQVTNKNILHALDKGEVVICDRYFDSSTAYQGYGRGIDLEIINKINFFATNGIKPDLTFLIDIDLKEMEKRKQLAAGELDRMEDQAADFFKKVRQGYLLIANNEPERFRVIDGKKSVDSISKEIWQEINNKIKL
ncbi:dTMP kinase [candidate division KSB1 bacterium 4572_119]|nr:MAG: dTMP kinase [candidate division KSB1 bacterium 4572_119]